jgi:hypothetical protein
MNYELWIMNYDDTEKQDRMRKIRAYKLRITFA